MHTSIIGARSCLTFEHTAFRAQILQAPENIQLGHAGGFGSFEGAHWRRRCLRLKTAGQRQIHAMRGSQFPIHNFRRSTGCKINQYRLFCLVIAGRDRNVMRAFASSECACRAKPALRAAAENFGQPHGHSGRNCTPRLHRRGWSGQTIALRLVFQR